LSIKKESIIKKYFFKFYFSMEKIKKKESKKEITNEGIK